MKRPELVREIVTAVVKAIEKPVTVKIRRGFDEDHLNAVEIAKIIEDSGAKAVAVHGRTREQYYSGKADWDTIRQVKEAVSVPVIASGGAGSIEDFITLFREIPDMDAGLAASIFHFGQVKIADLKRELHRAGIVVRQ